VAVCESVRLSSGAVCGAVFVLFGQASGLFIFGEQTSQTVETTGVGQEREASLFWSVGSVRLFVCSFVVSRLSKSASVRSSAWTAGTSDSMALLYSERSGNTQLLGVASQTTAVPSHLITQ